MKNLIAGALAALSLSTAAVAHDHWDHQYRGPAIIVLPWFSSHYQERYQPPSYYPVDETVRAFNSCITRSAKTYPIYDEPEVVGFSRLQSYCNSEASLYIDFMTQEANYYTIVEGERPALERARQTFHERYEWTQPR